MAASEWDELTAGTITDGGSEADGEKDRRGWIGEYAVRYCESRYVGGHRSFFFLVILFWLCCWSLQIPGCRPKKRQ